MNPKYPVWTACAFALSQLLAVNVAGAQATDVACTRCVNNSDLANNAVTSDKIQDGGVKANDIAASAVKTATINNGSVTFGKLATGVRDAVDGAIAHLTTTAVEDATIGIAEANCPSSRIVVSASCLCDDDNGNSNFGVLFACTVDGNGALAACFDEAGTFNPTLDSPVAIVQAICLGAESTDGTPWDPTPEGSFAPSSAASGMTDATAVATAQWRKEQYESLQAKAAELRAKRALHRSLLK